MEKFKKYKYFKISLLSAIFAFAFLFSGLALFKGNVNADIFIIEQQGQTGAILTQPEHYFEDSTVLASGVNDSYYCYRDDYILYTEDQEQNGFCWNFASNKALETTIAKATNQYYNFSEAWIGVANKKIVSSYIYGDAGHPYFFNTALNSYGAVLESDFTYDNSYLVNGENNNDFYNYYSKFASKQFMASNTASGNYKFHFASYNKSNTEQIKNHLLEHGALYMSVSWTSVTSTLVNSNKTIYFKTPTGTTNGGHAVTIIGWDDNVQVTYNGTNYKGAWICLNSWGDYTHNDGVFYIFYNDATISSICGYKYMGISGDFYYDNVLIEGNSTLKNKVQGKYASANNYTALTTQNYTKQKNIFTTTDEISLKYDYSGKISNNTEISNIRVYRDEVDITKLFEIEKQSAEKTFSVTLNNTESLDVGTYKVLVDYANEEKNDTYINPFYVIDGLEISEIKITSKPICAVSNNGYTKIFNSMNYNNLMIDLAFTGTIQNNTTISLRIYSTCYSSWNGRSGLIQNIVIPNNLNQDNPVILEDKIFTLNGYNIVIKIVYRYIQNTTNQKNVFVAYQLNGGINDEYNSGKIITDSNGNLLLNKPSKEGYVFAGWFYDENLTEQLEKQNDYYLYKNTRVINCDTTNNNRYAKSFYSTYFSNSSVAFVYAKWKESLPLVDITVSNNKTNYQINERYTLTANIIDALVDEFNITKIEWYKNDSLILGEDKLEITDSSNNQGAVLYKVKISYIYDEKSFTIESDEILIVIVNPISLVLNFNYETKQFAWNEVSGAIEYTVSLYKFFEDEEDTLIGAQTTSTTNNFTMPDITEKGIYYINVVATIQIDGQNVQSEEFRSGNIQYYEVTYKDFSTDSVLKTIIILENESLTNYVLSDTDKPGYTFDGWFTDKENKTKFVDGTQITGDLTLYSSWLLKDMTIDNIEDISAEYNGIEKIMQVVASHDSGLTEYTYVWLYKKSTAETEFQTIEDETNANLSVINVVDSGIYQCMVTLTDSDGNTTTAFSNEIVVEIAKMKTEIVVSAVKVSGYTYNGMTQKIDSGAVVKCLATGEEISGLTLDYELVSKLENDQYEEYDDFKNKIVKDKNSFLNVPIKDTFVKVSLGDGNENYEAESSYTDKLVVSKMQSKISVENLENEDVLHTWYTGKPIEPAYELNNKEQKAEFDGQLPVDANEDELPDEVTIFVNETRNFSSQSVTFYVVIHRVSILVVVHDKTSILFQPLNSLTFTVESGLCEGDTIEDLKIELECSADSGKIGKNSISIKCGNDNYRISEYEAVYTVTAIPYYMSVVVIIAVIGGVINIVKKRRFQYDFETNGGDILKPIDTKNKNTIILEKPQREGYSFAGWYLDPELTKPFNNKLKKSKGKTLYAKWIKIDSAISVSEEMNEAQNIVDEIQAIINKVEQEHTIKQNTKIENDNVDKVETPKSHEEEMNDIINSIAKNVEYSKEEMEEFVNKITNNK